MNGLARLATDTGERWIYQRAGRAHDIGGTLDDLLTLDVESMRERCESAREVDVSGQLLAPISSQDVWGAGVTYGRSREGRREESEHSRIYDLVFDAERPELFYKASGWQVVGHDQPVGLRADSEFDAPEPEITLVINSQGQVAGYTIGNDMTSRGIEGANPLYLPQAKIFTDSCALGPVVVPVWEVPDPTFEISLVVRRGDEVVYSGHTSTAAMARTFAELVSWLFRSLDFPRGVLLMTGTGIVPDSTFTVTDGDTVQIDASSLGRLCNPARRLKKEVNE